MMTSLGSLFCACKCHPRAGERDGSDMPLSKPSYRLNSHSGPLAP